MMGPEEQREFRLGWSVFRRAHQAVAKRSHKASRINKHATDHHANNMSTTLVVEEATPIRTEPAQLAHRRPSLARRRPAFSGRRTVGAR
jgi:hypothetical protein